MKQPKKLTRKEKKERFKTISNLVRQKAEGKRKDEARKLNKNFKD